MIATDPQGAWQDAMETISVHELSSASGLSPAQLHELVEYAALHPLPAMPAAPAATPFSAFSTYSNPLVFSATCVVPLRTACALQADYDLDLFTVGMLVGYLFRIDSLERQVQTLRAQLPQLRPDHGNPN